MAFGLLPTAEGQDLPHQHGRAGAGLFHGLDVFEQEPHVHSELLGLANVVLAPHIGSASRQTRLRMVEVAAENLIAAACGRTPPDLVNSQVLAASFSPGPASG